MVGKTKRRFAHPTRLWQNFAQACRHGSWADDRKLVVIIVVTLAKNAQPDLS